MDFEAIILGAGGAGLMAAATAGKAGARVLLIDHAEKAGKKILISGGGRCNFTNMRCEPSCYISQNPHFAKSALSRYTQWDFVALVERYGIAWHEKTLGQLFCDGSARQIVAMLLAECEAGGVTLRLSTQISPITHRDGWFFTGDARAPNLVIATGGPSIPKMGASDVAYRLAAQFGLALVQPRPALVPLTLPPEDAAFREISGVSFQGRARVNGVVFDEAVLFTHKGLSGPAILQISSYWRPGDELALTVLQNAEAKLLAAKHDMPRSQFKAALAAHLPQRLADVLTTRLGLSGQLGNMPDSALKDAAAQLSHFVFRPSGSEGYAKAEVTAGGIDTDELSSKTMEARRVPGLYVIGEAVDVTGWLGGYNFQWAWSSGVAAGKAIAARR